MIFFIGGFIYNVLDARSAQYTALSQMSLAFGMWWMVIPNTAIIACAMLASNNPSTLQGIVGRVADPAQLAHTNTGMSVIGPAAAWRHGLERVFRPCAGGDEQSLRARLLRRLSGMVENVYDSDFEPVTLWRRGPNKQRWVDEAIRRFESRDSARWAPSSYRVLMDIKRHFRLSFLDWVLMMGALLVILLGVPFAFAFATSYMTPKAGLSCRSVTHMVYFSTQVLQVGLWIPVYYMKRSRIPRWGFWLARFLQLVTGSFAVFATVGGTLMQIMGVYNNCLCKVRSSQAATLHCSSPVCSWFPSVRSVHNTGVTRTRPTRLFI